MAVLLWKLQKRQMMEEFPLFAQIISLMYLSTYPPPIQMRQMVVNMHVVSCAGDAWWSSEPTQQGGKGSQKASLVELEAPSTHQQHMTLSFCPLSFFAFFDCTHTRLLTTLSTHICSAMMGEGCL